MHCAPHKSVQEWGVYSTFLPGYPPVSQIQVPRLSRLLMLQLLPVRGVGLFSTSEDGSVRVSDMDRRKLVHDCRLHAGPVHAVRILLYCPHMLRSQTNMLPLFTSFRHVANTRRTSCMHRRTHGWTERSFISMLRCCTLDAGTCPLAGSLPAPRCERCGSSKRCVRVQLLPCTPYRTLYFTVRRQVAYSAVFSLAISGGRGRSALVWQPASRRLLAELTGHAASITHLAFDEQSSQVDSLMHISSSLVDMTLPPAVPACMHTVLLWACFI